MTSYLLTEGVADLTTEAGDRLVLDVRTSTSSYLLTEDGIDLTTEAGDRLLLDIRTSTTSYILTEDGSDLTSEADDRLVLDVRTSTAYILTEDGSDLTTEAGDGDDAGDRLVLESGGQPGVGGGSGGNDDLGFALGDLGIDGDAGGGSDDGGGIVVLAAPRTAQTLYALELDVYQPGTTTAVPYTLGRNSRPRNATPQALVGTTATSTTVYASDMGYKTRPSDPMGVRVYEPMLDQVFEIDRHLALVPSQASTATFGAVRLSNLGQRYDTFANGRNCDSRAVSILSGAKEFDTTRGVYVDPPYGSLKPFFGGFARPWQLSETELEIPLADATYWADRPLQSSLYAGTGGLEGASTLAGLPLPIARGGTSANPIQNVPLVTVDPVNLIYQYTDAPGTVVRLYEGGGEVFTYDGDAPNLYAGTPPSPGHYRTNNARGLVQMGSKPVRALTADVTGSSPLAGSVTTAAALARYVLTETLALPPAQIATGTFSTIDVTSPYVSGFWVGTQTTSALDVVQRLLGSVNARMISGRNGLIKAIQIPALTDDLVPSISFTTLNTISVTPQALPSELDPPPYRWRIGYNANYSVQTSDFEGAATEERKSYLAQPYSVSSWSSQAVLSAYRRPNDPGVVETYLLSASNASQLAGTLGARWAGRPDVFAVEVPMDLAARVDVGSIVLVTWPLGTLQSGRLGQIVGEQARSYDASCTFTVLMA